MNSSSPSDHPPNRLAHETSPYLLQHARNPVDWYPWGQAAFEKARLENKPIFLSVGYSACHWCHVMERESFENEEIARLLNENYVSIKVDREERPDVDQIYMSAVQLITRRGGWPMSVFLTADGKPFYGGTYWPPTSRMGMPGFRDILLKLTDYWNTKREEVDTSAEQLVEAIQGMAAPVFERAELNLDVLRHAMTSLVGSADRVQGGFGGAPKFPHPMDLRVLLRGWKRFGNEDALNVARLTLEKMARGGLYDQLGGGFHRYSTDAHWLVPHFEKMLYDNALLVPVYLEMFQITADPAFAKVAGGTLDYILREMTAPGGGFYSTQDADSEGEEGKFFVWSERETHGILGPEDAQVFNLCYDVTPRGNWEGHNILNQVKSAEQVAKILHLDPGEVEEILARSRKKLLSARSRRIAPARDEKNLVAWNGLMIAACAQASQILQRPEFLEAASNAANFILREMRDANGQLLHSYKDGQARFTAYLDDYACFIDGLLELFQATGEEPLLQAAIELTDDALRRFHDEAAGGFFYTAVNHEQLIARTKDSQDNATPSGNGMMATALAKLARLTGRDDYESLALSTVDSLSGLLIEHPRAGGQSLIALDFLLGPTAEVVVVDAGDEAAAPLLREVWKPFLPNKVVLPWNQQQPTELELLAGKLAKETSSLFICERGACRTPVTTPQAAAEQLAER